MMWRKRQTRDKLATNVHHNEQKHDNLVNILPNLSIQSDDLSIKSKKIDKDELIDQAIVAIKEALAQPEQEPVAWQLLGTAHFRKKLPKNADITAWNPLYPPPQRQPLTDEQIGNLWDGHVVPLFSKNEINPIVFARAIEAKLKEKNT